MLEWYEKLYIGEEIRPKAKKVIAKLKKGRFVQGAYLLTLASNPDNIMELIPSVCFNQRFLRENSPMIIGIAKDRDEALALMQQIVEDTYRVTGSFRVEDYIESRADLASASDGISWDG